MHPGASTANRHMGTTGGAQMSASDLPKTVSVWDCDSASNDFRRKGAPALADICVTSFQIVVVVKQCGSYDHTLTASRGTGCPATKYRVHAMIRFRSPTR